MRKLIYVMFLGLNFLFLQQTGICQTQGQMPQGDWKVSIRRSLFANSPIIVSSVSSDAQRGLAVSKVRLSLTEVGKRKPISKIRLGWVVIDETKNEKVVATGESGFVFLNPNQSSPIRLNSTVFSFASFVESQGINTLNGRFRVDILVSFVEFANGENWKFDLPSGNSINSQYVKASRKSKKTSEACPGQTCYWNQIISSYQCETSPGFACVNSTNGQSCTSSKCGSGGGEFELEM